MEFLLVLIVYPIFVILASVFGYFLFRKWFVFPSITLIVFMTLTFFVYNSSFFIWTIIYTFISLIFSLIIHYFQKKELQY
ncbi:DUF2651 family protein [Oceanobacillus kimchii]|uniref:DUF2651 family protein n=1 Tax=Oceanobacillus kimchii TaxID=746691 RepID=UPI001E29C4C0|nr:DUF2651 family protein [Oceanobacillus kimchii]